MLRQLIDLVTIVARALANSGTKDRSLPAPLDKRRAAAEAARREIETRKARLLEVQNSLHVEIYKSLITNTFDYLRTTTQALQTVTGLFLTAYLALLAAFRKDIGFPDLATLLWAMTPVFFWALSLASLLVTAITYGGFDFAVLGFEQAMNTYAMVLRARRRQLIAPAICTLLGIIAFAYVFDPILIRPAAAKSAVKQQAGPGAGAPSRHTP